MDQDLPFRGSEGTFSWRGGQFLVVPARPLALLPSASESIYASFSTFGWLCRSSRASRLRQSCSIFAIMGMEVEIKHNTHRLRTLNICLSP